MCEQRIEDAVSTALNAVTLKDLALSVGPPAATHKDGDGQRGEKR
jgi:hypothetical protein